MDESNPAGVVIGVALLIMISSALGFWIVSAIYSRTELAPKTAGDRRFIRWSGILIVLFSGVAVALTLGTDLSPLLVYGVPFAVFLAWMGIRIASSLRQSDSHTEQR
jgi:hypothetical protein